MGRHSAGASRGRGPGGGAGWAAVATLLVLGWTRGAVAQATAAFAPEVTIGLGAGAGFLGEASGWQACPTGEGDCRPLGGPAGGDASVFVGLRLLDWLSVELTYAVTMHAGDEGDAFERPTLQALRADARFLPAAGWWCEPYLRAGGGLYLLGDTFGAAGVGGGFELGAGVDLYLSRALSIGADAAWRGVGLGSFDVTMPDSAGGGRGTAGGGFVHGATVRIVLTVHRAF